MILVTGCTGYIGRRLVLRLLKSGHTVRGLVLPEEVSAAGQLLNAGLACWVGDLRDAGSLAGIADDVSLIYHLAGVHSTVPKMRELYVTGTQNLLNVCSQRLQTFVAASNSAVYGDGGDRWLTEKDVCQPVHPFGKLTQEMEQVVLTAVPAVILRLAEVYDDTMLNPHQMPQRVLGDGRNWRSYIHLDDVIEVLMQAPRLPHGQVYNAGDDMPLQPRCLYQALASRFGLPMPRWLRLEEAPERLLRSIHGLRALSARLCNARLKSLSGITLRAPSYAAKLLGEAA